MYTLLNIDSENAARKHTYKTFGYVEPTNTIVPIVMKKGNSNRRLDIYGQHHCVYHDSHDN